MRRREILTGIGTVATAAVAGCAGNSGDGDTRSGSTPADGGTTTTAGDPESTETATPTPSDDIGQTVTTESGLSLTLTEFVVTETVVSGDAIATVSDGEQYLLARMEIQNEGSERVEPPSADLFTAQASGETYETTEIGDSYSSGPYRQPVDGPVYNPPFSLSGSDTTEGWITVTVPTTADEITFGADGLSTTDSGPVEWLLRPTDDRTVTFDTSVEQSGEIIQQQDVSYTVSVRNTGGREGQFHQELVLRGDAVTREEISTTLAPSESVEQSVSTTVESDRTFTATLGDRTITDTSVTPPTFAVGETWTASDGMAVTVSDVQVTDSITYQTSDGERTATPPSGKQFLLFAVKAVNDSQEENMRLPDTFSVETAQTTVRGSYDLDGRDRQLQSPVTGQLYKPSTLAVYGPDQGEQGWVVFAVDAPATPEGMTVQTDHSVGLGEPDDIAAWSQPD
jgi:hypothetical protein